MHAFTFPLRCAASLGLLAALFSFSPVARADDGREFAGDVRLTLPPSIYAAPGTETNLYFDNVVLVVNPANYIFDVTCAKGFQYDDRWTFVPKADEAGEYPITLEVKDQSNTVVARARSIIRVAPTKSAKGRQDMTLLAIGDSHLQRDVYLQHVLALSKADASMNLTLVGCRGKGNAPPADDLRHEGYNGWRAEVFATRSLPKPRTGHYVPAETGSPFIYLDDKGGNPHLDFKRYCADFNSGKPVDYVIIQLGGNDVWNGTDESIDPLIDKVFGFYDILIRMIHDYSRETRIGIVMLDPLTRSQHGYRNYNGDRKQTRWQYRRNQHRVVEREIEKWGGRERENLFLVPVHLNLDCVSGFELRAYPRNARATTQEWRVNDGAHMSAEGYLQFGDPIYAWLKVCQARDQ
jgi:lysophospholipase L1-like esterase